MLAELDGTGANGGPAERRFGNFHAYEHHGPHGFSTDASGVTKTATGGWGICVAGKMAHGK